MSDPTELSARLQAALGPEYQVERPLDAGGASAGFLVEDLGLNRQLAVKVLSRDLLPASITLEQFRSDAEAVTKLAHPHLVPLHFIGEQDDLIYLAMQYVEGGRLADRIEVEGQLPVNEAGRILREIAAALEYAHQQGVVHGAITTRSIVLEADTGSALLTDFPIAQTAEARTLPGEPRDERTDIYALGEVGYEMVAGKPPFVALTASTLAMARLAGAPSLEARRPSTPPTLRNTIERMLAVKPEQRLQSAREVLRALAGGGPEYIVTPAIWRPTWRTVTVTALALLGVLVIFNRLVSPKPTVAAAEAGMVEIPAGSYPIGDNRDPLARPVHQVQLPAFSIDRTEVTVGGYAKFAARMRVPTPWKKEPNQALPVTGVNQAEAMRYCVWRHPPDGRLPTEAEWEAAARGTTGRKFPWGNDWLLDVARTGAAGAGPVPTGSNPKGATPEGIQDLIGNVWEWTASRMGGYPGNPLSDSLLNYAVIRGGGFDTPHSVATSTLRGYARPDAARSTLTQTGFRCVVPVRKASRESAIR